MSLKEYFFGSDSALHEHDIGTEPWQSDIESGERPCFLPRIMDDGGAIWYAIASNARGLTDRSISAARADKSAPSRSARSARTVSSVLRRDKSTIR